MPSSRARIALLAAAGLALAARAPATICQNSPVLTAVAADTQAEKLLFSLTDGGLEPRVWLVALDSNRRQASFFPDPLSDLRTGAAHGPGSFVVASRCGDDCFQPIRWKEPGWQPLGFPIEFDPSSTLQFTYDRTGSPWAVFLRLTGTEGVREATAYRWGGEAWAPRGRLRVQGVGSPAAGADPSDPEAVLAGTGRFHARDDPAYWLPALPVLAGSAGRNSAGGQVVALADGGAAFITFDSRVASSRDGATWQLERWTPWPNPLSRSDLWTPGVDYSIDRSPGGARGALQFLWHDERRPQYPALHLTRWIPGAGWSRDALLDSEAIGGAAIDHVISTADGGWLLLGPCRADPEASWLDALVVDAGSARPRAVRIPLNRGWSD